MAIRFDPLVRPLDQLKGQDGKVHVGAVHTMGSSRGTTARLKRSGALGGWLRPGELAILKKRDWRKLAICWVTRKRTVVPVVWIAEVLFMGHPNGASSLIRPDPSSKWGSEWKQATRLMKEIQK